MATFKVKGSYCVLMTAIAGGALWKLMRIIGGIVYFLRHVYFRTVACGTWSW